MKPIGPIPAEYAADEKGRLLIGGVDAKTLAAGGTPLFVYDMARVSEQAAPPFPVSRSIMPSRQTLTRHY